MRISVCLLLSAALLPPTFAAAEPGRFQSIELRGGGSVTVRHGAVRAVSVRSGDPALRPIRYEGDRLVIDRCRARCGAGHRLEVEVTTPELSGLAVTDGGTIQVSGEFPAQPSVSVSVSSGGTIDIRPLAASQVSAAVSQGGRIFVRPLRALSASVAHGGLVTYWGGASITSSVRDGGGVVRGDAAGLRAPLSSFDPTVQTPLVPPPVAPLPPKLPMPGRR